jgi:Leucine-rich repeat (LRR) protein
MQLTSLDAGFLGRFSKVRNLDLRGNQLTRLPAGIEQLAELRNLRLGGNRIVLSSDDNLRLSQLVGCAVWSSTATRFAATLDIIPLAAPFVLAQHRAGQLPAELARHGNLELLDMRGNQIQTLPEALSMLPLRLLRGWSCTTIHSRMKPSSACNWPGRGRGI